MFPPETVVEVTREAVRFAEKHLDSQLAIITALAQRAAGLTGVFGAGAAAMLAAEVLVLNSHHVDLALPAYGVALIAPAIMFIACVLCGMAAGTSTFQCCGNLPAAWQGNVTAADLNEALKGELENYQNYAVANDKVISAHARYLRVGLIVGGASPVALAMVGAIFFYLRGEQSLLPHISI